MRVSVFLVGAIFAGRSAALRVDEDQAPASGSGSASGSGAATTTAAPAIRALVDADKEMVSAVTAAGKAKAEAITAAKAAAEAQQQTQKATATAAESVSKAESAARQAVAAKSAASKEVAAAAALKAAGQGPSEVARKANEDAQRKVAAAIAAARHEAQLATKTAEESEAQYQKSKTAFEADSIAEIKDGAEAEHATENKVQKDAEKIAAEKQVTAAKLEASNATSRAVSGKYDLEKSEVEEKRLQDESAEKAAEARQKRQAAADSSAKVKDAKDSEAVKTLVTGAERASDKADKLTAEAMTAKAHMISVKADFEDEKHIAEKDARDVVLSQAAEQKAVKAAADAAASHTREVLELQKVQTQKHVDETAMSVAKAKKETAELKRVAGDRAARAMEANAVAEQQAVLAAAAERAAETAATDAEKKKAMTSKLSEEAAEAKAQYVKLAKEAAEASDAASTNAATQQAKSKKDAEALVGFTTNSPSVAADISDPASPGFETPTTAAP